jgi:hypothetical protein
MTAGVAVAMVVAYGSDSLYGVSFRPSPTSYLPSLALGILLTGRLRYLGLGKFPGSYEVL